MQLIFVSASGFFGKASSGSLARRAEALLIARGGESGGLSSLANQHGSFVSLAGVNIPSGESKQKHHWQCNTSVVAIHGGICGVRQPPP
tara:strand:+ start:434 stop:700 length:267 start_codon:yes stop_codon:yes gene_type:complete